MPSPDRLKSRYIGSFQFMFGLGTAVGPMLGGWMFLQLGQLVWPALAVGSLLATVLGLAAVRTRTEPAAPAATAASHPPRKRSRPTTPEATPKARPPNPLHVHRWSKERSGNGTHQCPPASPRSTAA
ncbi:hypothetical protein GCM10020000_38550 [Streptomyces olivoverticillatus]